MIEGYFTYQCRLKDPSKNISSNKLSLFQTGKINYLVVAIISFASLRASPQEAIFWVSFLYQ